jgi:hypothetical protein
MLVAIHTRLAGVVDVYRVVDRYFDQQYSILIERLIHSHQQEAMIMRMTGEMEKLHGNPLVRLALQLSRVKNIPQRARRVLKKLIAGRSIVRLARTESDSSSRS